MHPRRQAGRKSGHWHGSTDAHTGRHLRYHSSGHGMGGESIADAQRMAALRAGNKCQKDGHNRMLPTDPGQEGSSGWFRVPRHRQARCAGPGSQGIPHGIGHSPGGHWSRAKSRSNGKHRGSGAIDLPLTVFGVNRRGAVGHPTRCLVHHARGLFSLWGAPHRFFFDFLLFFSPKMTRSDTNLK